MDGGGGFKIFRNLNMVYLSLFPQSSEAFGIILFSYLLIRE